MSSLEDSASSLSYPGTPAPSSPSTPSARPRLHSTGNVEIIESLTATVEKQKAEKFDPQLEKAMIDWLFNFLEKKREDFPFNSTQALLKDGTLLCEIINKICPGAIVINRSNLVFKQMENIEKYIRCCARLGLPEVNRFNTVDLYEGKDMGVVLNNLRVVSQLIAKSDPATLSSLLAPAALSALAVPAKDPSAPLSGKGHRRYGSGIDVPAPAGASSPVLSSFNPYQASSKAPAHVSTLQDDLFVKEEMKYNPELERQAKKWIEELIGCTFPPNESLIGLLKSGVVLCKIINAVAEMGCKHVNLAPLSKIYEGGIAYKQMENIEQYKSACEKLGLKQTDLFVTSDLFEEKNINNVISHIHVFAKFVQKLEGYKGPIVEDSSKVRNLFSVTLVVADAPDAMFPGSSSTTVQLTAEQQELLNWINLKLTRPHSRRLGPLAFSSNGNSLSTTSNSNTIGLNDKPLDRVTNFSSDFRSGVVLLRLLEIVTKLSVGAYEKEPRILWHYIVNASLALRFLSTQACCKVECCTTQDIVMGRGDRISALVAFIRDRYDLEYLFMKELKKDGDVQFDDKELSSYGFKQLRHRRKSSKSESKSKKKSSSHRRRSSTATPAEGEGSKTRRKDDKKKGKRDKKRHREHTPSEQDESKRKRLLAAQNVVRLRVAKELLDTEKSYYRSLSQLNTHLIQPVKKAKLLTDEEFDRMFANIEHIVDGHEQLLSKLEAVMANWNESTPVAPVFANTGGFFHDYARYCANYNTALVYSYFLPKSNPAFAKALEDFDHLQRRHEGLTLPNILIMPVQRIPRYVLLLTDMKKYTNQRHVDYNELTDVLEEIKLILETINSKMNQRETLDLAKLIYALEVIDGVDLSTFLRPNSVYVREGVLTLKRVQSMKERRQSIRETISTAWRGKRSQTYYWFLFDDVLVSCDQTVDSDKPFLFVATLPLGDIQSVADKEGCDFMLVLEHEVWKIKASSEQEKQEWMTDLRTVIQSVKKKRRGTSAIAHSDLVIPYARASVSLTPRSQKGEKAS